MAQAAVALAMGRPADVDQRLERAVADILFGDEDFPMEKRALGWRGGRRTKPLRDLVEELGAGEVLPEADVWLDQDESEAPSA